MIVLKFGGTSVQDFESIDQAIDITVPYLPRSPLFVSSAMAGVTNDLVRITELIKTQKKDEVETTLLHLEKKHLAVVSRYSNPLLRTEAEKHIGEVFQDLRALAKGSLLLNECSPRVSDAILGTGELLSTRLVYFRCLDRGIQAELVDARTLIVTDSLFGEAAVLWEKTQIAVKAHLKPQSGRLIVTQGFIGATEAGVSTVLGRGGSDYSAALIGAALDAEEIQIWTDVDGIMTTDPRKVPQARSIPEITYPEAAELAFFGAKVVHPATIQPAVEKKIPVLVKNTKNASHPGTTIVKEAPGKGLRAIAGRKGVTLITVSSSRMLNAYGFLHRIFEIFQRFKTSVDLVATSEVSVSMTIEESKDISAIVQALEALGAVKVEKNSAILCLVGQEIWKDNLLISKVFQSIPQLSIKMISLGSSEINLSIVLKADDLDIAVSSIHRAFFEE